MGLLVCLDPPMWHLVWGFPVRIPTKELHQTQKGRILEDSDWGSHHKGESHAFGTRCGLRIKGFGSWISGLVDEHCSCRHVGIQMLQGATKRVHGHQIRALHI